MNSKNKILIVDDDSNILDLYSLFLEQQGFEVVSCKNGSDAIDWIWENHEKPDLLITDFNMPTFNGAQVIEQMRRRHGNVPAIIMTGTLEPKEMEECGKATPHVLGKPFIPNELMAMIRKVLPETKPNPEPAVAH